MFHAHDPQLRRDVALKIPRNEAIVSPRLRERFLREARAAAVLNHPNVIAVYEAGTVGPLCYISAEFCNGVTLAQWLKARRDAVPVRQAVALVATLAQAVAHAHARGILHRDLKPANIMLEAQDAGADVASLDRALCVLNPKITDFGLAKFFQEEDAASTRKVAR